MKNNQCNLCGLYFNPMIEKYKLYQNKCKCRTTPCIHDYKMVNGRVVPVSDEGKELPYPCSPLSQHEISTSPKDEGKCKCRRCVLKRKEIASRVTPPKTPSRNESWEERFDKFEPIYQIISFGSEDYKYISDELKSFIKSLLASQKAEWVEKIEGLQTSLRSENLSPEYNQALDDVIKLLSSSDSETLKDK